MDAEKLRMQHEVLWCLSSETLKHTLGFKLTAKEGVHLCSYSKLSFDSLFAILTLYREMFVSVLMLSVLAADGVYY